MTRATSELREPGSFRDPDSRVFYDDQGVVRALSPAGLADWQQLERTQLYERFRADGRLVATELLAERPADNGWAAFLRHERLPFISYPYEWSFSMLRDAALLQLDLLLAALDEGLVLKDATPYNVQFHGAQPVFIDVGSFESLREGEAWAGYRQFCMLFLYPLMLQAHRNVPFGPWLRGSLEGIPPEQAAAVLGRRGKGVFTHVRLHAKLERRYAARTGEVKRELRTARFGAELIKATARKLRKLVAGLEWRSGETAWTGYGAETSYSAADAERKERFVREAVHSRSWRLAWDVGCNDGRFSRIAAEHADAVVAMDADDAVVDALYRTLHDHGSRTILPLVVDAADPSPALGWRGLERKTLPDRGRPELTLALAVLHHLAIPRNVPLAELVGWLRSLDSACVIEFATREDAQVQRLLAAKREGMHGDYERDGFERLLTEAFVVERSEELAGGTRMLYFARPR